MTTVAGGGQPNRYPDNVPAVATDVYPGAIAFDPAGNLLILSGGIRRVDANTGIITTIVRSDYGDCGDVMDTQRVCLVNAYYGFTADADGNLFIADTGNHRVLRVDRQKNLVTTIAGTTRKKGFSGNNVDAKSALLNNPSAVAVDNVRKFLYVADESNDVVRKIDLATNIITTVAGGGSASNDFGDNGPATSAVLSAPAGLVVDTAGNLLISDRGYAHDRIRKLDISTGIITSVVTSLKNPLGMAVDAGGNIFFAEEQAFAVRKFDLTHQILSTVAGNNQPWLVEENVPATAATLRNPIGISVDPEGNLFITDAGTERIRKVDAGTGFIHTIAGGGQPPDGVGDNGPATNARLAGSGYTLGFDRDGNIYIAERWHYRVRKIDKATGTITTVAGNDQNESSGDGGLAIHAGVIPNGVALDRLGNLYIAENDVGRVRRVNLSTGFITTVAGGGIGPPGGGDNGPATRAVLGSEFRIAADAFGNLFIADTDNARVRRVDAATQEITTVAGGRSTPIKDNVPATSVRLLPIAVAVDAAGNLFILDWGYPTGIRKVAADTRLITTVAGVDKTELGDNGPAIDATMYYPYGITVDSQGNVFIADTSNQRIRAIRGPIP